MKTLIAALQKLVDQSTEALGADDPATLNLKEQLAAALEQQEQSRKVFWIQPQGFVPRAGEKKD